MMHDSIGMKTVSVASVTLSIRKTMTQPPSMQAQSNSVPSVSRIVFRREVGYSQLSQSPFKRVIASISTPVTRNSKWATGDWNGDGDFTTTDLVLALREGGYEQGPREDAKAVPEPTTFVILVAGLIGIAIRRRHIGA